MRRGIGLRGYAQQDPLNEFKREAFQLYDELRGLIRHGVASSIFRVTVTRQPSRPAGGRDPAVAAALARGAAALRGGNGSQRRDRRRGAAAIRGGSRAGDAAAAGRLGHPARWPAGPPTARPMRESLGDQPISAAARGGPSAGGPKPGLHAERARIGRNDPCWCGSGAKYKKCHGR